MRSPLFALILLVCISIPACQTAPKPDTTDSDTPKKGLFTRRHSSELHALLAKAQSQLHDDSRHHHHRQTIAKIVETWRSNPNAPTGHFKLTVQSAISSHVDPLFYDEYVNADACSTRTLKTRHVRPGIGAPLIGRKTYSPNHPLSHYQPEDGYETPLTAVLNFPEPGHAVITIYDPDKTPVVDGHPLAADFSAPLSNALGDIGQLRRQGFLGMIRTGDPDFAPGFLLTQPYDPDKTPLILVHGLLSSQAAWRNVANDLIADPEIRKRYQIWFYHYPTGNPVLVSAQVFRQKLDQLRQQLDPLQRDPAMQNTVIIAHSMGGLLSKTLVTDSGDFMWDRTFTISKNQFPSHISKRKLVVDTFYWKARPEVQRIIYIAVPHRGSKLATSFIGRCAQRLIRLPSTIINVSHELIQLDTRALTDEAISNFENLSFTSVHNLSLNAPTLLALNQLPVAPWVHQHSIIGVLNRRKPLEKTSDGVVPYPSSHLDNVESEFIVRSYHGAYKKPETVQELIRILKLR